MLMIRDQIVFDIMMCQQPAGVPGIFRSHKIDLTKGF
jgi:hypothetical protein